MLSKGQYKIGFILQLWMPIHLASESFRSISDEGTKEIMLMNKLGEVCKILFQE